MYSKVVPNRLNPPNSLFGLVGDVVRILGRNLLVAQVHSLGWVPAAYHLWSFPEEVALDHVAHLVDRLSDRNPYWT